MIPCTSHIEVKKGFAASALKTLRNFVSTVQRAFSPKKPKNQPQAVCATLTREISHQSGTPDVTSGVGAAILVESDDDISVQKPFDDASEVPEDGEKAEPGTALYSQCSEGFLHYSTDNTNTTSYIS